MYPLTIHKKESTTQASDVPQLSLPEPFCIPPTPPPGNYYSEFCVHPSFPLLDVFTRIFMHL